MTRNILAFAALGLLSIGEVHGQIAKSGEQAVESQGAPSKAVKDLVDRLEGAMMSAANAMPAEKYGFTPASLNIPGAKFAGVRTFADEVKHVAQSNYIIAANISGTEPATDTKAIAALKSKDEIVAALAGSFAAVQEAITTITVANANKPVDDVGVGQNQTKASEAAWVAVHGYDHYGQLVEYLRMNGIIPGQR